MRSEEIGGGSRTSAGARTAPPPSAPALSASALSMRASAAVSVCTVKPGAERALCGSLSGPTVSRISAPFSSASPSPLRTTTSVRASMTEGLSSSSRRRPTEALTLESCGLEVASATTFDTYVDLTNHVNSSGSICGGARRAE